MKERPILFSAPMVRAILDGRKTQTRRIVKPQPANVDGWRTDGHGSWYPYNHADSSGGLGVPGELVTCPYGTPDDRLWVRETWCLAHPDYHDTDKEAGDRPVRDGRFCFYAATDDVDTGNGSPWKPSIYMPRWASRLALAVTAVRVEQLQEISELDALAEGVEGERVESVLNGVRGEYIVGTARDSYAALWDDINGDRAPWASNPWVWVIEFKRATEGSTP